MGIGLHRTLGCKPISGWFEATAVPGPAGRGIEATSKELGDDGAGFTEFMTGTGFNLVAS